jgi:hypothetical protein
MSSNMAGGWGIPALNGEFCIAMVDHQTILIYMYIVIFGPCTKYSCFCVPVMNIAIVWYV